MPKKVAKVNRIHLDTFKNPVLLTLTRSSLRGGMEAYSDYLKKIIPSLTIWSREDIENSPPFNLPFMKEASWSIAYARRVHLERDRPDLILSSGMHGWAFGPTERNIPSLSILHGTFAGLSDTAYSPTNLQYWRMRYAYSFLERKSAQNAHVRVANSPFTQKEVKRYYGLNSRAILPPIDSQNFRPGSKSSARKELGWDLGDQIILFVGNPTFSKGWDIVIELARAYPEYRFICLCNPVISFPLPNLFVFPFVSQEQLSTYYRAADLLLFPSRYEGFGFVPLEALASGCPVISSRVGIFHDFHSAGRVEVKHSPQAFNHALRETMEGKVEKVDAKKVAKSFSFKAFSQLFDEAITEAERCIL